MRITLVLLFVFAFSFLDAQIIWTTGMEVSSNSYGNLHPRIVVNASNQPLIIWGNMDNESVYLSRWNGNAFTLPVKLNPSWLTVATAGWMGPDIAAKGDTVYIVMKQTPEADINSHIYIVSSFDGGITFSSPAQVDNIADSISRFPAVTVDALGNPLVAFMKFDNAFMDSRWVVTKSSDYGNSFSNDVEASGWSGADALVCDCCPGSIASNSDNIALLYRNNQNNIRDSWVGISNDGGATFTDGWNIDQNNWNIFSCPSTGPDGAIIGDSLYAVFMSGANDTRVYRSTSSVSSGTAQPSQLLTGSIPGLNSQNYPRIATTGNAIAIAWKQTVNDEDQLPVLFTNDISDGFPSTYDTVDLGDITNTDIALSNGNIFVVWQDDNSGTVKYRTGTFAISTAVSFIIGNETFEVFPNPVSDLLTISCNGLNVAHIDFSVIDAQGRIVYAFNSCSSKEPMVIDTKHFPNGMYFLKAVTEEKCFVKKFIIEHNHDY